MKRLFYTLLIIGSLSLSMMVTSCKESTVYYKYAHTSIAGWEKNDTLSFAIPPLTSTGLYQENLGLRITGAYPFMGITLIVEQEIFPNQESKKEKEERNKLQIMGVKSHQAKKVAHGEKIVKLDTIQCNLINKDGVTTGQGISYYQYNFPINLYHFNENDSIHIMIRHDMKREILPGISDIGIKLEKR